MYQQIAVPVFMYHYGSNPSYVSWSKPVHLTKGDVTYPNMVWLIMNEITPKLMNSNMNMYLNWVDYY